MDEDDEERALSIRESILVAIDAEIVVGIADMVEGFNGSGMPPVTVEEVLKHCRDLQMEGKCLVSPNGKTVAVPDHKE